MNTRPRFMNPDVERQVLADPTLFIAWCLTNNTYDWEIDPMHNPDWVRRRQVEEIQLLTSLKAKVSEYALEHGAALPNKTEV